MLQYIYFSLSNYKDIKCYDVYYNITHMSYNFKTKNLEFKITEYEYDEYLFNDMISASEELIIKYITKGIKQSNDFNDLLHNNNIISNVMS